MPSVPEMVVGEDEGVGPRADLLWRPPPETPAYSLLTTSQNYKWYQFLQFIFVYWHSELQVKENICSNLKKDNYNQRFKSMSWKTRVIVKEL